jgi:hypothetical protein
VSALTPEREDEIRAAATRRGRYIDGLRLRDLLDEIDALRRLPVIAMCGDCRWCHPTEVCTHERAHIEQEIDGSDRTPPSWCPLRGAR